MKVVKKIKNGAMWVALAAIALYPLGLLAPTVAQAAGEFTVTGTGVGSYDTLTAAIAASGTNSVITIAAGTYHENVTVDKQVTIQAATGATVNWGSSNYLENNFNVTADNVTISGLIMDSDAGYIDGYAVGYAGIKLATGVSGCTISNNTISGGNDGILLAPGSSYNTFINNNVSDNVNQGFEIIESDSNTFTGNIANSMDKYGFKLVSSSHNVFTNNTANLNTRDGFNLAVAYAELTKGIAGSNYNVFTNNTANLNTEQGIQIGGSYGNVFSGNTIDHNTVSGFKMDDDTASGQTVTDLTIDHNTITNNAKGIEIIAGATPASWTVTNNDLTNTAGISNLGTGTLIAPLNWFGSATGPYNAVSNPDGTGSPVTSLVTITGWAIGATLQYRAHVENTGWQAWVADNTVAGTTGQALRMEAVQIETIGASNGTSVEYRAHVQNVGWQAWVADGATAGTTGEALRMEAVQIELVRSDTSVYYRGHVQYVGWQDGVADGATAGTTGQALRMEAVQLHAE